MFLWIVLVIVLILIGVCTWMDMVDKNEALVVDEDLGIETIEPDAADFNVLAIEFKDVVDKIKKCGGRIRIDARGLILIDEKGKEYLILRPHS